MSNSHTCGLLDVLAKLRLALGVPAVEMLLVTSGRLIEALVGIRFIGPMSDDLLVISLCLTGTVLEPIPTPPFFSWETASSAKIFFIQTPSNQK